jgi:hypothetical protein
MFSGRNPTPSPRVMVISDTSARVSAAHTQALSKAQAAIHFFMVPFLPTIGWVHAAILHARSRFQVA